MIWFEMGGYGLYLLIYTGCCVWIAVCGLLCLIGTAYAE